MRSSLASVAPEPSPDDVVRRRRALEPTLWRRHGVVVLRLDDPDLLGLERLMIERIARVRFGKQSTAEDGR